MNDRNYDSDLDTLLHGGQALIIVPPFASLDRPSLAAHILQGCAKRAGYCVRVFYANILLASAIGAKDYIPFCEARAGVAHMALPGERLFARSAHGLEPLGHWADRFLDPSLVFDTERVTQSGQGALGPRQSFLDLTKLQRLEELATVWVDEVAVAVSRLPFQVIGCTTTFEQTNASIALLRHIKRHEPQIVTIIGGANCEGGMAQGIASLDPTGECIDYIFSGESEATFPNFLRNLFSGHLSSDRIIYGTLCLELDAIPTPDFTEYFEQHGHFLSDEKELIGEACLPYETSRGCWWGQKHQCTFCGLNAEGMVFRQKSPDRVIGELETFAQSYPTRNVAMVDNVMPHTYFRTLVPRIAGELPPLKIFYEERSNLSLDQVLALKKAGIGIIQPGIEALSSALLKRMNKGVKARQNIMLLRYARSAALNVRWNLLWGFPGDEIESYEQTLALLPLLRHLQPPSGMHHLTLDRFSSYLGHPERYGISNVRPLGVYAAVLPSFAEVEKVAYHFSANYDCASHQNPEIIRKIMWQVTAWKNEWTSGSKSAPALHVARSGDSYVLIDKRGLPNGQLIQPLNEDQAFVALVSQPYNETEEIAWALDRKIGVMVDAWYVPLATAKPELLQEFESKV